MPTRIVKLQRSRPVQDVAIPLWSVSAKLIGNIRAGKATVATPLTILAGHIRDLCGKNVEHYQKCSQVSRDIYASAHRNTYTVGRRKRPTDTTVRSELLKRARELEELARTLEARQSNEPLEALCLLVAQAGHELRDETVSLANAAN